MNIQGMEYPGEAAGAKTPECRTNSINVDAVSLGEHVCVITSNVETLCRDMMTGLPVSKNTLSETTVVLEWQVYNNKLF